MFVYISSRFKIFESLQGRSWYRVPLMFAVQIGEPGRSSKWHIDLMKAVSAFARRSLAVGNCLQSDVMIVFGSCHHLCHNGRSFKNPVRTRLIPRVWGAKKNRTMPSMYEVESCCSRVKLIQLGRTVVRISASSESIFSLQILQSIRWPHKFGASFIGLLHRWVVFL